MKFFVSDEVFQTFPDVCFGVVVAKNINNENSIAAIQRDLAESVAAVEQRFRGVNVKEAAEIKIYRDAFEALGMNANKFPSSIEAMISRVAKGKGLPSINPVVDLGNAVSLTEAVPLGAHDLDRMSDDIAVRFSKDGDLFRPFGQEACEELEAGELIYAVGNHVRTRRWIWRQSEEGKITERSKHIFFPVDGFTKRNIASVFKARDTLARRLETYFHCDVQVGMVDSTSPEFIITGV